MGGGAFLQAAAQDEPTLRTPRMSPDTYAHLKKTYTQRLKDYLPNNTVSCLLEAPEKTDYGDIDFIISTDQELDAVDLARAVGARGVICDHSQRCTLAVRTDGSRSDRSAVEYRSVNTKVNATDRKPSQVLSEEVYAQIDIEAVPPSLFAWHSFYASYGDMASLLGKFVHYFGFTVTDKGLLSRMQELDDAKATPYLNVDDSHGKLFLSRDPDLVMRFLGFEPERYYEGFGTTGEFYMWLSECRLLSPDTIKYKRNNSHERNREQKRSVYANFLEEWLPKHFGVEPKDHDYEDSQKPDVSDRKKQLQEEAINFFNKRDEYESMHNALVLSIRNQTAAHLLKPIIAEHSGSRDKKLNEIVRAFRRWVVFTNGLPVVAETPHTDEESQLHFWLADDQETLRHEGAISEFVKVNWERLRTLERQRVKDAREGGTG